MVVPWVRSRSVYHSRSTEYLVFSPFTSFFCTFNNGTGDLSHRSSVSSSRTACTPTPTCRGVCRRTLRTPGGHLSRVRVLVERGWANPLRVTRLKTTCRSRKGLVRLLPPPRQGFLRRLSGVTTYEKVRGDLSLSLYSTLSLLLTIPFCFHVTFVTFYRCNIIDDLDFEV